MRGEEKLDRAADDLRQRRLQPGQDRQHVLHVEGDAVVLRGGLSIRLRIGIGVDPNMVVRLLLLALSGTAVVRLDTAKPENRARHAAMLCSEDVCRTATCFPHGMQPSAAAALQPQLCGHR